MVRAFSHSPAPPLPRSPSRARIGEDDGRRALLVDGVVQSVEVEAGRQVDGYWAALLPSVRPRRALVLGLGGGRVVPLLHRRFGPTAVVGVEADAAGVGPAPAGPGLG